MLSEYFAYMFILYEVAILYFIVRALGKGRHALLWAPTMVFILISLVQFIVSDRFYSLYHHIIISQWNSKFVLKLAVCLWLSALAWRMCGVRKNRIMTERVAAGWLTLIFSVGLVFSGAARYFNFPYNLSASDEESFWLREWHPGYVYYDCSVMLSVPYEGGVSFTTQCELDIYERPDTGSDIVGSIPSGLNITWIEAWFSHPTQVKGWRYVGFGSNSVFSTGEAVRGYARTSDVIKFLATGQKSWPLSLLARGHLFTTDDYLYDEYRTLTPDYARLYYPSGIQLSAALLLLSAAAFGFLSLRKPKQT